MKCSKCIGSPLASTLHTCSSCHWRAARRQALAPSTAEPSDDAWQGLMKGLQPIDEQVARLQLLALMLGEDGAASAQRASRATVPGEHAPFDTELLRLARKLLARVDEF